MTISEHQILDELAVTALVESLGKTFLELRECSYLTQREAAAKMGTAQYKVSELERGDWDPKLSTLVRYLSAYGYDVEISLVARDKE